MFALSKKSCGLIVLVLYVLFGGVPGLWADGPFVGWSEVPGHSTTTTSDAAVTFQNRLYLFGIGIGDHAHYMNVFDGTQWAGWKLLPGGGTTNLADAAASSDGKLYLFGIGIGDHAHYMNSSGTTASYVARAPYDLVWDSTDDNGFPLNPRWGKQDRYMFDTGSHDLWVPEARPRIYDDCLTVR